MEDGHGIQVRAAGLIKCGIEGILGLKIQKGKIKLEPCIPKEWKEYCISYRYKTSIYNIKVQNPDGKNTGVDRVFLNAHEVKEKEITLEDNGKTNEILIWM